TSVLSESIAARSVRIDHQRSQVPLAHRTAITTVAIDRPTAADIATPTAAPRSPSRASNSATPQAANAERIEIQAYPRAPPASRPNTIIHSPPPTTPRATDPPRIGNGSRKIGRGGPDGKSPDGIRIG